MAVKMWTGRDTRQTGPEFYDVTHVGRVLELRERNGYDDSDFYAVVWDDEANDTREVFYATTRAWTYNNSATVDADEETRAKVEALNAKRRADYEAVSATVEAAKPLKGRHVRVTKGRKVPVGTEGEVFWYGEDKYTRRDWLTDDGRVGYRVGLVTDDGEKFFTAATNVEVS